MRVEKHFSLSVNRPCQELWAGLRRFKGLQALNTNSIYHEESGDPSKIPEYLSALGLDPELIDQEDSESAKTECSAAGVQCDGEEYVMYGEFYEWVPDYLKVSCNY